MPIRFTQRILQHLAHERYRPVLPRELAKELQIDQDDRALFADAVKQLGEAGDLEIGRDDRLRLPPLKDEIVGRVKVNARGFGFLVPDKPVREGDVFIPPGNLADAISGDRVRARLSQRRGGGPPGKSSLVGTVVEVIERGQTHFVGMLTRRGKDWVVLPDGNSLHDPVIIRDPHAKNAKQGDKVVLELLHYPEGRYLSQGVITEVLGEAGRPDVETRAVITAHGLRDDFDGAIVDEARKTASGFDEHADGPWEEREDLTDVFTLTIDPPDAKDFDDAITISRDTKEDEWTLGVHIADVATFVTAKSALDVEAHARGNSVYLPRLVIPMLPELLSNGVCSLQEGVKRFTKSAFITFDHRGRVMSQRLCRSVIKSNKRLTYLEAQALIDGDRKAARTHARTETAYTDEMIEALQHCNQLARILRKRRQKDGMIVLNLPQVDLVFDDEGHVIDAVPEDDAYTHTIIEMFMVEANEAVARTFDDLGVPIIRRVHPHPAMADMEELRIYARVAGVNIPDNPTRKDLQRLLDATRESPAARAIHFAVLRTLTKATYSPAMIGHFALASDHYTHFTSPIRRYPDLSIHRAIDAYLDATDNGTNVPGGRKRRALGRNLLEDDRMLDEDQLVRLGRHCSETEVEATEAERELRDYLVLKLLHEKHLGDEFTGLVTGVMASGVFVSIEKYLVEGMVRNQDLPQSKGRADRWVVNEATRRLVAGRSGASIGLGDLITVQIARVDLASRRMDLLISKLPESATRPPAKRTLKHIPAGKTTPKPKSKPKGHRKGYGKGRRGGGHGR